eukprot:TRINITY_DN1172_c0_g1_i1.p1 TRINITY_DN1172_c0_g1~~TRINITY_DN1172_c0_g1_i1.p1  ORF type:complete len:1022 (+),score=261.87 TRINITY_DN1172_c0_g1_i1:128-3193(+)
MATRGRAWSKGTAGDSVPIPLVIERAKKAQSQLDTLLSAYKKVLLLLEKQRATAQSIQDDIVRIDSDPTSSNLEDVLKLKEMFASSAEKLQKLRSACTLITPSAPPSPALALSTPAPRATSTRKRKTSVSQHRSPGGSVGSADSGAGGRSLRESRSRQSSRSSSPVPPSRATSSSLSADAPSSSAKSASSSPQARPKSSSSKTSPRASPSPSPAPSPTSSRSPSVGGGHVDSGTDSDTESARIVSHQHKKNNSSASSQDVPRISVSKERIAASSSRKSRRSVSAPAPPMSIVSNGSEENIKSNSSDDGHPSSHTPPSTNLSSPASSRRGHGDGSGESDVSSTKTSPSPVTAPGKLAVKVSIPEAAINFQTRLPSDFSIKQVKQELMKKLKRAGVHNLNPDVYYIKTGGLRILEEQTHLSLYSQGGGGQVDIELLRPIEFEITFASAAERNRKPLMIATEAMTVEMVAKKLAPLVWPRLNLHNLEYSVYTTKPAKSPVSCENGNKFVSYGLRSGDVFEVFAESVGDELETHRQTFKIIYSPFDSLDEQKSLLRRNGYLKKQGGSKGGNKSWLKRWFELENNQVLYYVDKDKKALKGTIEMTKFVSAAHEPQKKNDAYFYFAIVTSDRKVLVRSNSKEEMEWWIEGLKAYGDLVQFEQSLVQKESINQGLEVKEAFIRRLTRKTTINVLRRGKLEQNLDTGVISSPVNVRRLFSVSADFQWNSDEDPLVVFDFLEELGVGACGRVLKAQHKKLTSLVLAVKIVLQGNKAVQEELEKEMEILKKCRSPNVIAYYGTVLREKETWILMDYCGVGSVKDVMKVTCENLTETQCRYVILHTLKGLQYMHSMAILHLDVKAANILLTEEGVVKLADFGVSQVLKTSDMTKEQDDYVGSPLFMAPEVIRKQGYNNRADIWSMGITIIEMIQGRPPNNDINSIKKLPELAERPPPTFKDPRKYSTDFSQFLADCLVKKKATRPSALDLLTHKYMLNVPGPEVLKEIIYEAMSFRKKKPVDPLTLQVIASK